MQAQPQEQQIRPAVARGSGRKLGSSGSRITRDASLAMHRRRGNAYAACLLCLELWPLWFFERLTYCLIIGVSMHLQPLLSQCSSIITTAAVVGGQWSCVQWYKQAFSFV